MIAQDPQPVWAIESRPGWCDRLQQDNDHPDDRDHYSPDAVIPLHLEPSPR